MVRPSIVAWVNSILGTCCKGAVDKKGDKILAGYSNSGTGIHTRLKSRYGWPIWIVPTSQPGLCSHGPSTHVCAMCQLKVFNSGQIILSVHISHTEMAHCTSFLRRIFTHVIFWETVISLLQIPTKNLSPFLCTSPLQYVPKIQFTQATIDRLTKNKT